MRFSCAKADLERAAMIAERFTGKQTTLPVLGHVLLSADAHGLTLSATNLEHAAELSVPARVSREGRVLVPAKIFSSLLQSMGDTAIDGEGERGNLRLRTPSREGVLNGSPADDFPIIPKVKKISEFSVDAASLAAGLSRVLPAVSLSEFKPELSGVFFHPPRPLRDGADGVGGLTLCATDTFRLAEQTIPLVKNGSADAASFILPHRAAQELARLLEGADERVSLVYGESQMSADTGKGRIISRLIDGAFPDYKAIIPGKFATSMYVSRDEVLRGIRAASIFASKLQEITLHLAGTEIEMKAENPEVGVYHTRCPAAQSGKEIAMSFNWRYLFDGLQQLEDEEIFFGCNDAGAPALMRNKSHDAFLYVVMPIRLSR